MIVTLTELGPHKFVIDLLRGTHRRRMLLTAGLRAALSERGKRLWSTDDFGSGLCGQQAQYRVGGKEH